MHVHDKALLSAFSGPVVNGVITLAFLAGRPNGVSALSAATAKVKNEIATKVTIDGNIYDNNDNDREDSNNDMNYDDMIGDHTVPGYEAESVSETAGTTLDTVTTTTASMHAINKPQKSTEFPTSTSAVDKVIEPLIVTVLKTREGVILDLDDTGEGGADVQVREIFMAYVILS